MSSEKNITISNQRKIDKIINAIKIFLFGDKIRKKDIEKSIYRLKKENEYLKQPDENNKVAQASVMTNYQRIAALNYMKNLKKSRNKKGIIIVE